jgi:hypothetical protein
MLHCHLPHYMMNHMVSVVGPMAETGWDMPTGMDMGAGMRMVEKGTALSEELGPGLGRGMGFSATREKAVSHRVGRHPTSHESMGATSMGEKKRVPGYPQDMWMPMDDAVAKPETYGLRPSWSGAVQGMMTLVRIFPADDYQKMMDLTRKNRK